MNKSHLSRDPLALTILGILAEQPRHPYEIQRLIRDRKKDFARSTQRTLYHAIDRLVYEIADATLSEKQQSNA